jgi:hypothetical protein
MEKLDLADRLEESHQRNGELVQLGLAAARASTERDARMIATLEARLRSAKELHWATVEAVDVKSAPYAKHTASRTSWLHMRKDSKTCQSIFPEN